MHSSTDNTSSGEPLSNGSREKLRKKQTELMKDITSPLKLLDILGEKGVLRRYARKDMKRDNNGDDELKRAILNYITDKGTYHDVEKLMEALVELHQIFVANKMYKYFSPEGLSFMINKNKINKIDDLYSSLPLFSEHFTIVYN